MNRNIFTKSMFRQPLRTALFALLLVVAAFSFVMRSMEYIVINEQINEISAFFRPIGTLGYTGVIFEPDVRQAAEIVSMSPYVNFDDKRRNIEAVLLDMPNSGSNTVSERMVGRNVWPPRDAFFYGTLVDVKRDENAPYIVMSVEVDSVMLGYPEHVSQGQTLDIHYFMDYNEIQAGTTAIDNMLVGDRYFMRGVFHRTWTARESGSYLTYNDIFVMHPLSEFTYTESYSRERYIPRYGVWYITAPQGESSSFLIPGLEDLYEELQWIRYSLSKTRIQTTEDMSYLPFMQLRRGLPRAVLTEGRWISRDDNERSNPIIVVEEGFASKRGLSVGDTIRLGFTHGFQKSGGYFIYGYELGVSFGEGVVHAPFTHTLELEIVGIIGVVNASGMLAPHDDFIDFMYIPDSVLPLDVTMSEFEWSWSEGEDKIKYTVEEGYIAYNWYSFVLNDARDADAFMLESSEALAELGFYIEFLPGVAGAQAFWDAADMIMQTIWFNLVLFSIVAVLILVLVAFLYIRQRHRDYAILRALGNPARRSSRQLITTLLLFALPAVIIGGAGGWFIAIGESAKALESLPGIQQAGIDMLWLPVLIVAVLAGLLILTLIGIIIRRCPVLEMLQGTAAKRGKR